MTEREARVFWALHMRYKEKWPGLREGQSMMNALARIRPDLYDAVTGTEADCFYNDNRINDFREAVGI